MTDGTNGGCAYGKVSREKISGIERRIDEVNTHVAEMCSTLTTKLDNLQSDIDRRFSRFMPITLAAVLTFMASTITCLITLLAVR